MSMLTIILIASSILILFLALYVAVGRKKVAGILLAIISIIFNLTIGTILFLQLPKTPSFTGRLLDNMANKTGWRQELAAIIWYRIVLKIDSKH